MMALAKCAAVWGTTERILSPSRTCRCQSSGVVIVIDVRTAAAAAAAAGVGLGAAAEGVLLMQRLLLLLLIHNLVPEVLGQLVEAARLPAGRKTSRFVRGHSARALQRQHFLSSMQSKLQLLTCQPGSSKCWYSLAQHTEHSTLPTLSTAGHSAQLDSSQKFGSHTHSG